MDAKYLELEVENVRLRAENEQFRREVRELRATVEKLTAALEAAQRAAKRQAAPFRKSDDPAVAPKKPGRKKGRRHCLHAHRTVPASHEIDETYEAPLPDRCPSCDSRHIEQTHTAKQYETEIPRRAIHREFTIHIGECHGCGQRVQGRHAQLATHGRAHHSGV